MFWIGAIVVIVVPAILVATVARRWLLRAMLLWLMAPMLLFFGAIYWEIFTRPPVDNAIGTAFYGLALISSILAIPWIITCSIGFGLGFALRRLLRTDPAIAAMPLPAAEPGEQRAAALASVQDTDTALADDAPPDCTTDRAAAGPAGWRDVHVGFANDELKMDGLEIWKHAWRSAGAQPIQLPHPAYPNQTHRYDIYEVGVASRPIRFAASELSNGVWGFYVPTNSLIGCDGISADGTLRFEHRIGKFIDDDDAPTSFYAVLIDVATGRLLVDCAAWPSSRITPNADGSLFLHLQRKYFDMLFRIDPGTRQFHNHGEDRADQPLSRLAALLDDARSATEPKTLPPHYRRISPDGTIRVDIASVEWANSHWVYSPRVTEIASGRVVLDLWDTDWDADISFPGARQVALELRRYHHGGGLSVALDLAQGTYQISDEPGHEGPLAHAPLADITDGLEASSQRSAAIVAAMPRAEPIKPPQSVAWRGILMIVIGILIASAIATIWSVTRSPVPPQKLTPMPVMPKLRLLLQPEPQPRRHHPRPTKGRQAISTGQWGNPLALPARGWGSEALP